MSRIGKKLIAVPGNVKITNEGSKLTIKGEKGELTRSLHPSVALSVKDGFIHVTTSINNKKTDALQGLTRSLVANMVTGVSAGFKKDLEVSGIGYRASVSENTLTLTLGYSHPINYDLPVGVTATVDKNNVISLMGIDNELIGQTAAKIRHLRPPEPYKAKGVKYAEERIKRKAGKTGTK